MLHIFYGYWYTSNILLAFWQDIPDVDGDREFGIQSFSVKLGQEKVSIWILLRLLHFPCSLFGFLEEDGEDKKIWDVHKPATQLIVVFPKNSFLSLIPDLKWNHVEHMLKKKLKKPWNIALHVLWCSW